jgi:hypothetical protein
MDVRSSAADLVPFFFFVRSTAVFRALCMRRAHCCEAELIERPVLFQRQFGIDFTRRAKPLASCNCPFGVDSVAPPLFLWEAHYPALGSL